jgi:hypothetical protein
VNCDEEELKSPHGNRKEASLGRDSVVSAKSLKSYSRFRESLGKMHAYLDKVSGLD